MKKNSLNKSALILEDSTITITKEKKKLFGIWKENNVPLNLEKQNEANSAEICVLICVLSYRMLFG